MYLKLELCSFITIRQWILVCIVQNGHYQSAHPLLSIEYMICNAEWSIQYSICSYDMCFKSFYAMLNLIKKMDTKSINWETRIIQWHWRLKYLSIDSFIEHNNTLKYLWWWCLLYVVKLSWYSCAFDGSLDLKIEMNLNWVSITLKNEFISDFGKYLNELVELAGQPLTEQMEEWMNKLTFEINTFTH